MKGSERAGTVLLVDDDAAVRTVFSALLRQVGIAVLEAASGADALETLATGAVDVMVTDLRMPGMNGMELLHRSLDTWPDVPVIVLTAYGTVPGAVDAVRRGAVNFLEKAADRADVLQVIQGALEESRRRSKPPPPPPGDGAIIGEALDALRDTMRRAASGTANVLIRGENGTGKGLVARAIHDASPRSQGPFLHVNCAELPETLFESEMFGFSKGAFTGATQDTPGRIELAHGGTLFLDEIGDYSPAMQVKLLRVLEQRKIRRLGSAKVVDVDVRFVFATNRNLEELRKRGEFRDDLYFRMDVVRIQVPPLRERPEDIAPLTRHFTARSAAANARPALELLPNALELLAAQAWPGNVRELENFVERLVLFTDGTRITRADVERQLKDDWARAPTPDTRSPGSGLVVTRREAEKSEIIEALRRTGNNRAHAARILQISRRTFYNKLEQYELLSFPFTDESKATLLV